MTSNIQLPNDPVGVLQAFLDANRRGDMEGMKACLSQASLEGDGFTGPDSELANSTLGEPEEFDGKLIIPIHANGAEAGSDDEHAPQALPAVMIEENGQWKFDLVGTMDMLFGDEGLGGALDQVANAFGEAMEQVGDAIGKAFDEAFGREPVSWDHVSLYPDEAELWPLPELHPCATVQQRLCEALGFDVTAHVTFDMLGSNLTDAQRADAQPYLNWFDKTFMPVWVDLLAEVNQMIPLQGRLSGLRVEPIRDADMRMVAVDGNSIIYRVNPHNTDMMYSMDELRSILPGVAAGLPMEIVPVFEGMRELPHMEDVIQRRNYMDFTGPRCMRRISELLGREIRLRVDWNRMYDSYVENLVLWHWGLNRIVGGVALALLNEETREEVANGFQEVVFGADRGGDDARLRYTKYKELELRLPEYARDGRNCLYEYQIAQAFAGRVFEAEI